MVYVDDMYLTEMGRYGRMRMSHMIADSTAELIDAARSVGVQARWLQKSGTHQEHFDICMSKRKKLIGRANVVECTVKELTIMCMYRREHGILPTSIAVAMNWWRNKT